jgi:hypothetical protein
VPSSLLHFLWIGNREALHFILLGKWEGTEDLVSNFVFKAIYHYLIFFRIKLILLNIRHHCYSGNEFAITHYTTAASTFGSSQRGFSTMGPSPRTLSGTTSPKKSSLDGNFTKLGSYSRSTQPISAPVSPPKRRPFSGSKFTYLPWKPKVHDSQKILMCSCKKTLFL